MEHNTSSLNDVECKIEQLVKNDRWIPLGDGVAKPTDSGKTVVDLLKERMMSLLNGTEFTFDSFEDYYGGELVNGTSGWPSVDDGEGHTESLNTENFEVIYVSDEKMMVQCGGDWQSPLWVLIESNGNNLIVTDFQTVTEWKDGISYEDIYNILK